MIANAWFPAILSESMVKKQQRRIRGRLGFGYYHPRAIQSRIEAAERAGRTKRVIHLKSLLLQVKAMPQTRVLTKSWRCEKARARRRGKMIRLRRSGLTLQEVGHIFHITRERVRQILNQTKNER